MKRSPNEFVSKFDLRAVRFLALHQEIGILCGCSKCGRRLVHNGVITEGARVVYAGPLDLLGTVFCSVCFAEAGYDYNPY